MGRMIRYREWRQYTRYYTGIFKWQLKKKNMAKIKFTRVPGILRDQFGIEVVDPNSPDFPHPRVKHEILTNHPAYPRVVPEEEHPRYKGTPCLLHDGSKPFAEGLKQALILTKSLPRYGIPETLLEKLNSFNLDSEKDRIFQLIMQSQAWDPTFEKLPKRRDQEVWWIKHPRYYGIPEVRKNNVLLDNLHRFTLTLSGRYNELTKLRHFKDGEINALTERNDMLMRMFYNPRITVAAPEPLKILDNDETVMKTRDEKIEDIYPVGPMIDLQPQNIYDDTQTYPLMWSDTPLVPRTILQSKTFDLNYPWTPTETVANAMMASFGLAVSYAQKKYSIPSSKLFQQILPQPITVQCVQVCRGVFDFVIFQLNTLDLSNDQGVKNRFWIDKDNKMFSTPPFYETFKEVKDYDPNVLKKFLSVMLNSVN